MAVVGYWCKLKVAYMPLRLVSVAIGFLCVISGNDRLTFHTQSQQSAVPDLSGRWKMVERKINFYGFSGPKSLEYTITQTATAVEILSVRDGRKDKTKILTDGSTWIFDLPSATNQTNARARWEGLSLVVEFTTAIEDRNGAKAGVSRWDTRHTLAPDGKTLVVKTRYPHNNTEKVPPELVMLFVKQYPH